MITILLTNDDGIQSPGLAALRDAVAGIGKTVIVAPDRDNSAVSHSLTMSRPLRLKELDDDTFALDGTPTDCVIVGISKVLERKPDLLISGINAGPNIGDDIAYSGTVSAAVEGTMYGIPSLAVSQAGEAPYNYSLAQTIIQRMVRKVLQTPLPPDTLMNINIPEQQHYKGIQITRQGRRLWENAIKETLDPWGRTHYWIGGGTAKIDIGVDTDVRALHEGYVSVTPIHLDLTNHAGLDLLRATWKFEEE